MSIESPSCLAAPGSVRASRRPKLARWASVVQTFWPLTSQPPDTGTARVWTPAMSEPAPGFGEQLAPHLAPGEDSRHVAASLGIGSELQQRRQAVAERDRELLRHQREAAGLLPPRRLVGGWQTVAAEGRRHAQPGQTGGVQCALEAERPIQREIPAWVVRRCGRGGCGVGAEEAAGAAHGTRSRSSSTGGCPSRVHVAPASRREHRRDQGPWSCSADEMASPSSAPADDRRRFASAAPARDLGPWSVDD